MPSPHYPKPRKPGDYEPRIPGWAADRMIELRIQRESAPPWVREEIDKQIERLKQIRYEHPDA